MNTDLKFTDFENPVSVLNETCFWIFRKPLLAEVVGKTGADHCPEIEVKITLPNKESFTGKGRNKKEARREAAVKALERLNKNNV
jgi:dsRNA-specific ribonuclease